VWSYTNDNYLQTSGTSSTYTLYYNNGSFALSSSTSGKIYLFAEDDSTAVKHTITASAGDGGSISPNGAVEVKDGKDKAFTVTPADNYVIEKVLVDGADVTTALADGVYTFKNVTADHTISATFEKVPTNTYKLVDHITPGGKYLIVSPNKTIDDFFVLTHTGTSSSYGAVEIFKAEAPVQTIEYVTANSGNVEWVAEKNGAGYNLYNLQNNTKYYLESASAGSNPTTSVNSSLSYSSHYWLYNTTDNVDNEVSLLLQQYRYEL
jgi:hypothetical protein